MQYKNRGMLLESIINKTLKIYSDNDVALFHKKNLDISFAGIKNDNEGKPEITKGWISTKSTTDYYGIYKGIFITFEAKSTNLKSLPLNNIKDHQIRYINRINELGGLGFFIIAYATYDEYYLVHPSIIDETNQNSISIDLARERGRKIELVYPGILDFLPLLDEMM